MSDPHGNFVWYELLTGDADAASAFYGAVIGWTASDSGQAAMDYRFFHAGDAGIAGFMPITPDMAAGGAQPSWLGYIAVDDVDASVASMVEAGATVHMPAFDLDGVGRMAMVADAQGVPFYIMRGFSDEPSVSFAADEPRVGHCAWNELSTTDPVNAVDFYTSQFGWRQEGEMDMGPLGTYQFLYHGPGMIGAIMPKMPEMPAAAWTYYFRVADIDGAASTIAAHGGTILQEPIEIPGGEYSLVAIDPAGAAFGLVGARV